MRSQISSVPFARGAGGSPRSFGILSTFPPTPCGIATFSAALAAGLIATGSTVDVVRCGRGPGAGGRLGARVARRGPAERLRGRRRSAQPHRRRHRSNTSTGSTAGMTGPMCSSVMAGLTVPCIVVAHTVVRDPTANQRAVLEQVCDAADAVVVMTTTARNRLIDDFDVEPSKVRVIPHGATTPAGTAWVTTDEANVAGTRSPVASRLLTWGLLGPGQGHRVGDRRGRQPHRRAPTPELHRRRCDPSQGPRAIGRGVPRDAGPSSLEFGRRAVRHVR